MTNKFKVGDKVVCVDAAHGLTLGKTYTICGIEKYWDDPLVWLVDDSSCQQLHYADRFKLAEPEQSLDDLYERSNFKVRERHKQVIDLWVKGYQVQVWSGIAGAWIDCSPDWTCAYEYRIKPKDQTKAKIEAAKAKLTAEELKLLGLE